MQGGRASSSRLEDLCVGTIIDALDVTMPDEHDYATEAARAPRSTEATGTARLCALQGGSRPQAKAPLITAVEIENFKGIGRPIRVDLRPITLLFGRNSAGKSTILHALCYAHELLSHGQVDASRTELGGAQVDLGGFRRFVHAHDPKRTVRLRFDLNLMDWETPTALVTMLRSEYADTDFEVTELEAQVTSGWVELQAELRGDRPLVASYEVGVNETLVGRIRARHQESVILEFNPVHPLLVGGHSGDISGDRDHSVDAVQRQATVRRMREVPGSKADSWQLSYADVFGLTSALPHWGEVLSLIGHGELKNAKLQSLLSILLVGIGQTLRNELARFRYIGPVRKLRPRVEAEPGSADQESWSDGSAAWNRLLPAPPDPSRPDLLKEVNDWLARHDRLDTGYRLTRKSTVELPAAPPPVSWIRFRDRLSAEYRNEHGAVDLGRWAKELAATIANLHHGDPDDIETRIKADPGDRGESADENPAERTNYAEEELVDAVRERYQFLVNLDRLEKGHHPSAVRDIVGAIAAAPVRTELQLVAAESELPIRTSDIGVGISQLLPVAVAALDPDRPGITAIEQPELHLHPKLQVELGDLFAQPADDGRVFLLENHSEHLMLRLLRRIEETHSGELPEGKPALRPDQVSVVFLEQIDGEVRATPLRIDKTGEFIDRWPRGFFRERAAELF